MDSPSFRRQIYILLITLATAMAVGRVLSTQRVYEPHLAPPPDVTNDFRYQAWPATPPRAVPTFGSNDRSRWDTVRALVDDGTFAIGRHDPFLVSPENPEGITGIASEDGWRTVDKVLHPERQVFLSSKPPLLTVLMAGQYWLLKHTVGWSIADQPYEVVRAGLLTFNVLPFALYLWLLSRLAEQFGATDWGRLFVVTAAAFGTLLTPFLITFNNHTPAAVAALVALYAALRAGFPWRGEEWGAGSGGEGIRGVPEFDFSPVPHPHRPVTGWLVLSGLAAGFLVNCELPGLAFAAVLGLCLLVRAPGRTLLCFAPPVLLFIALYFSLNYLATGQLLPVYEKLDTPWYQYPGGLWAKIHPGGGRGIEYAKFIESRWAYAFHLFSGHHGWFSLTPIHLLGAAGMAVGVANLGKRAAGRKGPAPGIGWEVTAVSTLATSAVVFAFYAFVVSTANYGGWTNGPRWLLWLTPLWLLCMLPVADWLGTRRWGRALALVLLALSVLSASYQLWNPWRHPWIYNLMDARGWIPY
jgi:hypothetical protein